MNLSSRTVLRRAARWLGPVFAASAVHAAGVPNPPYMGLSDDGAYVLDARALVAWPRCVEGMHWNGKTCIGTPLLLNHGEAMALARDLEKERGLHLRVPRALELQALSRSRYHSSSEARSWREGATPSSPAVSA